MADDPIDRMLQREDAGTSREAGTLAEARQATSEMARPESGVASDRDTSILGMFRKLARPNSNRDMRDTRR